jgi:hypothetical protein
VTVTSYDSSDVHLDEWKTRDVSRYQNQSRRYSLQRWREAHALHMGLTNVSCQWALSDSVKVHIGTEGHQYVSGVASCGRLGVCPVCAPKVRSTRAADIEAAVEAWHALGGQVVFATYTVPHSRTDSLASVLQSLREGWRHVNNGAAGRRVASAAGSEGFIRSLEVTYGSNGWHAHIHSLFFVSPGALFTSFSEPWRQFFTSRGWNYVPRVSCDVRPVVPGSSADGIGAYLGKLGQTWGAGLELARADLKHSKSVTPQQILELAASGDKQYYRLWCEWETATKGVRWIEWARKLRVKACTWQAQAVARGHRLHQVVLDTEAASDVEAAAANHLDEVVAVVHVPKAVWQKWRNAGRLGELLQHLTGNQGDALGCFTIRSAPYP